MLFPTVFLGIGIWTLSGTLRAVVGGSDAIGTVVGHNTNIDSDGDTYQPIISFRPTEGPQVTFTELVARSGIDPVGSEVPVLYDPDNPTDARLNSFANLWVIPLAFLGFGSLFPGLWLRGMLKRRNGSAEPDTPTSVLSSSDEQAWYRRTEMVFHGENTKYVVVGVDDAGQEIRSKELVTDPSADIIANGSRIAIELDRGERVLSI